MNTARRLFDILDYQQEHYPQNVALAVKNGNQWRKHSTTDFRNCVDHVSAGLLEYGIDAGDKVSLISYNRPEWNFVDLGTQQIGAVIVPLYHNINAETYAYILNDAESRIVFVEGQEVYNKLQTVRDELKTVEAIYTFDEVDGAKHWSEILPDDVTSSLAFVEGRKNDILEDDLATIIYTSGTTGKPKGVMLSHNNILSNVKACAPFIPIDNNHIALSLLPLNHVFERMVSYLYMLAGVSIYYAESPQKFAENVREVKPHIFTTVPRLLEKVYEDIVSKGKDLSFIQRTIFFWALHLAENYEIGGKGLLYNLQHTLADNLVYEKWREALGDNLMAIISGGAALNPRLARVFTAAGVPILEGYGLTETSPVLAVNRYEKEGRRIGSVGRPLDNVDIKIAMDDEILARGPNIMQGYLNKPDATDEVIDDDGWLHTEDLGEIDETGFLYITDRVNNVFKTSGGKFVVPQRIENTFKESFLIDQIMIIGKDRKMVTAIISPDFDNLKQWCDEHGVAWVDDHEKILENANIQLRYETLIQQKNQQLDHTEQVKQYTLVPDSWSVEDGELTPTMKVKRKKLREQYAQVIEQMYSDS